MFSGNSRFKLLRRLGAGGMGVVYEALDQQRQTRVALKTLRQTDADLLYRLKREFRSLRDLAHRNLIILDELFEEDGDWFFTMELLDGEDLHAYLHRIARVPTSLGEAATSGGWGASGNLPTAPGHDVPAGDRPPDLSMTPPPPVAVDDTSPRDRAVEFDQVREVFAQVSEGLLAIHDAGKIHRDIKPSNIIVTTRERRAVILDFGLVTEQWDAARSGEGKIVGSVMYMAPEQAAARAVGPEADWYSVGVMLYEAVAGRRPFDGAIGVVLAAKQYTEPPDPKVFNSACPDDLADLCKRLLKTDPRQRPQGLDVLRRLGIARRRDTPATLSGPITLPQRRLFIGRDAELRELRKAFDDVHDLDSGGAITAFVYGESGIGKTTLIQHFVTAIESENARTVVLAGQCREHEAVPFKAMDGVIDALSRYVCGLSEVAAAELVPHNAALLPGVFPVLGRIPAIAKAPGPIHAASDPFQQRKRVFTALREMLCLLSERNRLIWVIDDMQWVDSDSLRLLGELLRPPDQPRMLLLASVRTADEEPTLPQLPSEVRRIRLSRLNPAESVELTGMLLDRIAPEQRTQTTRIVDETAGHPLFIGELVRYAAADSRAAITPLRLDEAIWARVSQLQPGPLGVLKLVSVAVAPLSKGVIHAASRLDPGEFQRSVALLRTGNLIRSAVSAHELVEVYHDRVRQSVVHHLGDDERIALNERIAIALETSGAPIQPDLLIHHLEGARQLDKAARKALEAAERAQAGLAFERAIHLYESALRLTTWSEDENRDILIKLGGVLASAGRGPEAARAYTRAAEGADPITQLTCRIEVADQLVQSGLLETGAALMFSLFQEHGHHLPGSQVQVALRIVWYRIKLALRGLRWTDRRKDEIVPRDLALLSLYKAASRGLILVDPVRASYFVIRGLHLAMKLGDRDFIMYFLWLESGFRGGEGANKHTAFLERANELMRSHTDPRFQTFYRLYMGASMYLSIDRHFKQAFEILDRSDEALAQTANAAWELSAGRFFLIYSLHKIGDFARLRAYSERFIREAEQRGNVYTRTTISRLCNVLWLVADDPARAREDLKTDSWISYSQGYHLQHWHELNARVEIAIYEGSAIDKEFLAQHLEGLKKSFLQRVLGYRCDTAWLVGRMALSEALQAPAQLGVVRRSIAKLLSYETHYPRMLATMLRATLAVHEGKLDRATADFREVVAMGEATHIAFVTEAARRRLGALIGGDEGRALIAAAERWMTEAGIASFDRMTNLASPCKLPAALLAAAP
ncbi:MAG TPA: protein kinase [Kofleriaceae bacterium]